MSASSSTYRLNERTCECFVDMSVGNSMIDDMSESKKHKQSMNDDMNIRNSMSDDKIDILFI